MHPRRPSIKFHNFGAGSVERLVPPETLQSFTIFRQDWNETIIPNRSIEFDTDVYEEEVMNLLGLETNESNAEVSSSFLYLRHFDIRSHATYLF